MTVRPPKDPAGRGRSWLFVFVLLLGAPAARAFAQAPAAPAAPPEPPPRLEASGQFSFLDTRGNADTQSLGAGGEMAYRPAPMTYRARIAFAQTERLMETSARDRSPDSSARRAS